VSVKMSVLEGFAEVVTTLNNSSLDDSRAAGGNSITPTTVIESSVGGDDYSTTMDTPDMIVTRSRRNAHLRTPIGSTGYELVLADDGEGGTYYVQRNTGSSIIAVFKPINEEIGCSGNPRGHSRGCRVEGFVPGTGASREVAAYVLDDHHTAHVPITIMRDVVGKGPGSFQQFIPGLQQSWNMASSVRERVPLADLQYLALFDIRVFNTDRHGGNILVDPVTGSLTAIDHSYILPRQFVDPEWDWLSWPESRSPILTHVREYYLRRDDAKDADSLCKTGIDEESIRFFQASAAALRLILREFPSYNLIQIAELFRRPTIATPSVFEQCLASSRAPLEEGGNILQAKFEKLLRSMLH